MRCPKCGIEMDEVRKLDVIVDVCSKCGGVWLDRGELDALREAWAGHQNAPSELRYEERREHHDKHGHDDRYDEHKGGQKKKRGSFLDVLDMFGGGGE